MEMTTIFVALFLMYAVVDLNIAYEARPSQRIMPMLSFAGNNEIDSSNDDFFGLSQPSWLSARDTDGYTSLFETPIRPRSFFVPPIRPNAYLERMMESMNKHGEMMRKEMEKMPATHETNEQVITLGDRKFVKQCKTTKRGSGSALMMETVCKLVPHSDSQSGDNSQVVTPNEQPKQQPNKTSWNESEKKVEPKTTEQQEIVPSNGSTAANGDELRHQKMDDDSGETMEVPKS